jgi:hypothetical protein
MYRRDFATKKVALSALGALEPGMSISAQGALDIGTAVIGFDQLVIVARRPRRGALDIH